jgi:hypothetical protein
MSSLDSSDVTAMVRSRATIFGTAPLPASEAMYAASCYSECQGGGGGVIGADGATGATGATGPAGERGPTGGIGTQILNGVGPPASTLGNTGDFYMDTVAGLLYGPKADVYYYTWNSLYSLLRTSTMGTAYLYTSTFPAVNQTTLYLVLPAGVGVSILLYAYDDQGEVVDVTVNGGQTYAADGGTAYELSNTNAFAVAQTLAYICLPGRVLSQFRFQKTSDSSQVVVWVKDPWYQSTSIRGPAGADAVDTWIQQYLIAAPPAPLGLTIDSTNNSSYIDAYWKYPTQVNVGFQSGWLPQLVSFKAQLEGVTYGGVPDSTVVLDTSDSHFINSHNGVNPIILLRFNPFVGASGYLAGGPTYNGIVHPAYVYRDANFSSMTDGLGLLNIWYTNYNVNSGTFVHTSTASPLTFNLAKGPPEPPTNLAAFDSGSISGGKNYETISFTKSSFANSENHMDTNASVARYVYTYTLQSTSSRYGGKIDDSGTVTITVVNQGISSYSTNTLFNPGSIYLISLTATNGYSLTCAPVTLTTTQTNFPVAPSATAFTMTSRFYPSVIRISDGATITRLLNLYTSWASSGTFIVPIHTTANRGSTASSIATLVYSITGGALAGSPGFPTITFDGFPATTGYPSAGTGPTLIYPTTSTADVYGDAPSQGFYLQSINSFTIDLTQTSCFINSNILYTITTVGGATNTYTFYYDKWTGAPTVTPTVTLGASSTTYVSGIVVYGTTESFEIQLLCGNMGDYFCPSIISRCRVTLADASDSSTKSGAYSTKGVADVSGDTITAGTFKYNGTLGGVKISYSDTEGLDSYAIATVSIDGTVYNIVTSTNFDSASTSTVKIVIDQPSIDLLSLIPTSLPTVGASDEFVYGRLVPSGPADNTTTYVPSYYATNSVTSLGDVAYNHQTLMTSNTELLIANGKFRTVGTSPYYRNYTAYSNPNYSSITSSSAYRSATFAWKIDLGAGGVGNGLSLNKISFLIAGVKYGTLTESANGTLYITGTDVYPLIYYRYEQQNYSGTDYRIPNGSNTIGAATNYNTDWINMNSLASPQLANGNRNIYSSTTASGVSPPVTKAGFATYTTPNRIDYTLSPNIPVSAKITALVYLYFRIVLPMNVDFEFATVSANLYSG